MKSEQRSFRNIHQFKAKIILRIDKCQKLISKVPMGGTHGPTKEISSKN